MSDYLWDKEGEPDPEIERLETLLAPLAHRPSPLPLPAARPRRHVFIPVALVAAAALVAILATRPWRPRAALHDGAPTTIARASWRATVNGSGASTDGHALAGESSVLVGAWIDSGASRVTLRVGEIGTVELAPKTLARIVESSAKQQRLELEHGALAAKVDAPPRTFAVVTKRLVVTDLGCAFTLTVDEAGYGRLVVTEGKVAVASGGAGEVVVPAGAESELTDEEAGAPHSTAAQTPTPSEPRPSPTPSPNPPRETPHAAHTKHAATKTPAAHGKVPPHPSAPVHKNEPTHKSEPTRVTHDPLKDLERSVE